MKLALKEPFIIASLPKTNINLCTLRGSSHSAVPITEPREKSFGHRTAQWGTDRMPDLQKPLDAKQGLSGQQQGGDGYKLTWTLTMVPWKMVFLYQPVVLGSE